MLKKWVTALLGLLTVILALVIFGSSAKAAEIPTAGLTGTDAVVTDHFGNVITNTGTMNKWQDYTVKYNWSIRDGQPIKAGDTAVVELPNGAIADKNLSFPLTDSTGRVIGNFSIKAGDTTGTITFNESLAGVGTNREGTLEFFAKGTQNNDNHYGWVINKIGWVSGYDETGLPSELTWNVAFNPEEIDIGHVVVTDTLGQNQTYVPGSVYAETGSYNSAGEFIANGTVTPTVSQNGNVVSFTFEGIKSAVNMVYRAKLNHVTNSQTKWENTATMNGTTVNSSVAWGGAGTGNGENPLGSVVLMKEDSSTEAPIAGAKYELRDDQNNVIQSDLTTGADGKLTIQDLTPGTYSFVETTPPSGYLLNHTPITFTIKANATAEPVEVTQVDVPVEEIEVPQTGDVTLTKTDAKTKAVLAGAVYELRNSLGKVMQSNLTTDAQGQLTVKDLPAGKYTLVEIKAPAGYEINPAPVVFAVEMNFTTHQVVNVSQTDEKGEVPPTLGSVRFTKRNGETFDPVAGAVYQLTNSEGVVVADNLTSDADGHFTVKGLPAGNYQFKETKAPAGYDLNTRPVSFQITAGNTTEVVQVGQSDWPIPDIPGTGDVTLVKTDSTKQHLLAGAVYELRNHLGNLITKNLTTNAAGEIVVKDLPEGTYQFVEVKAPAGYELDPTPIKFTIGADNTTMVTVTATDVTTPVEPETGEVILTKTDAAKKNVLAGAIYELQNSTGQVLQSGLTTNSQGQIRVDKLLPGEYQFVETQAPKGYQLNRQPLKFTVTAGQTAAVEVAATDEANTPEEPEQPNEEEPGTPVKPEQPGGTPENPGEEPGQPGGTPENPGEEPGQPGGTPENPGEEPGQPGGTPENPGEEPGQPGVTNENPGEGPSQPLLPQLPDLSETPEQPGTFEVVPGAPSTGTLVSNGTSSATGAGRPSGLPQTNDHSSLAAVIAGLIGLLTGIFGWVYLDRRRA